MLNKTKTHDYHFFITQEMHKKLLKLQKQTQIDSMSKFMRMIITLAFPYLGKFVNAIRDFRNRHPKYRDLTVDCHIYISKLHTLFRIKEI